MTRLPFRLRADGDDSGAALVIVLGLVAVLTVLGATSAILATNNTRASGTDRQAASAMGISEAGLAQGVEYLRQNAGKLKCSPTCNPALGQPDWGRPAGHSVTVSSGKTYSVWIEKVQAYAPPAVKTGLYRVHSTGTSGGGPTARTVTVDATIVPFTFPIGVFAHTVDAGGNGGIHYESLFSDSCIQGRNKVDFQGNDAYYGVPAAAHSANYIVPKQNDSCTAGNSIHSGAACNTSYPNDTDLSGGPLVSGSSCYGNGPTLFGSPWLTTSKETSNANMAATYRFSSSGLSNDQLDMLRTISQQQGFYYTNTTAIPAVLQSGSPATTYPNPVLFYDLKGAAVGGTVDLKDLQGYSRTVPLAQTDASCTSYGAVVIILNGNVKMNGNTTLVASVYAPGPAPNGQVSKANGTNKLIGTLYADSIDLTGTADVYLDDCFVNNMPMPMNVKISNFQENDR